MVHPSRVVWSRQAPSANLVYKTKIKHGGKFLFRCNYDPKDCKTYSKFDNELLQWWVYFRAYFSTNPLTFESIIWNNKDIKIDGKPIYYPIYVNAGILFCYHLQFDNNNLQAYNNAIDAGLRNTNFLEWTGIRSANPAHLKAIHES